ncbi:coiled-coil domain-containing protein 137 [Ischnura elegans]|uniref:coiled-coil domain-containing protein 137 n=1 Tax=Ischnura elegans TaxID=197161 RepID=UPI001ED8AFBE|nr:coiled-coil domain-containing protein 137 [Ischnura elegans]XP_046394118.1 coiled-coil domain-containing protein 137 [Ischnura elegans]
MGRKIPGKKCKKIKDPEKQRAARLESLNGKIDLPPALPDAQEVPHSLERLMELKNCGREKLKVKKRKKNKGKLITSNQLFGKEVALPGMAKALRPTPNLNQKKGESDDHFLHRVERLCQNMIKETKFEKKFGVEVHRNPTSGVIEEVTKCNEDELDRGKIIPKKLASKVFVNVKRSKAKKAVKKLSKIEKQQSDFGHLRDEVKFGEVVHQPPTLKVFPKKTQNKANGRPGQKDLILKKLLLPAFGASGSGSAGKAKWKELSPGDRMKIEQRRENAVFAYKMLKAQKSLK